MADNVTESSFQHHFHARRGHLANRHVRDLAWLLDSPDLLDRGSPLWGGRIGSLFSHQGAEIDDWLRRLDAHCADLDLLIASHGFNRLGRYSELLMAFFLRHLGILEAHGLQVRSTGPGGETVGEFDFLLRAPDSRLLHWEFATKFYLLEPDAARRPDALVGPNLADTLGAKMRKILERQLNLSRHESARAVLPEMPALAQALIKGWLFYPESDDAQSIVPGVNPEHCKGFWMPLSDFARRTHDCFLLLPRLNWLAPARCTQTDCLDKDTASKVLKQHFVSDDQPLMLAFMERDGETAFEVGRGFIVRDDWAGRARQFVHQ